MAFADPVSSARPPPISVALASRCQAVAYTSPAVLRGSDVEPQFLTEALRLPFAAVFGRFRGMDDVAAEAVLSGSARLWVGTLDHTDPEGPPWWKVGAVRFRYILVAQASEPWKVRALRPTGTSAGRDPFLWERRLPVGDQERVVRALGLILQERFLLVASDAEMLDIGRAAVREASTSRANEESGGDYRVVSGEKAAGESARCRSPAQGERLTLTVDAAKKNMTFALNRVEEARFERCFGEEKGKCVRDGDGWACRASIRSRDDRRLLAGAMEALGFEWMTPGEPQWWRNDDPGENP